MVRTVAGGRTFPVSRATWASVGAGTAGVAGAAPVAFLGAWASTSPGVVTSAAAPAAPAAAFLRKPRRPTEVFCDLAMICSFRPVRRTAPIQLTDFTLAGAKRLSGLFCSAFNPFRSEPAYYLLSRHRYGHGRRRRTRGLRAGTWRKHGGY